MTIADTDVLIDFLTGKGEADTVEELLRRGSLRTTVISPFELLSGARSPKQLARLTQLLGAVASLSLDDAATDAGIVVSNGGTLLTRNRRHFERVPGMSLA
jgi:predicted nucleic acid-binding protein